MNKKRKKVLIVTGSRSEYDLLKPLILEFKQNKNFKTKVVVTGSHLSKKYGYTYKKILKDKIKIDKKINLNIKSDNKIDLIKHFAIGLKKFYSHLKYIRPDLVIVLGDRYEIFSFVVSCYILNIPVAHIHGGELTQGSIDEGFRHSITKMSQLHLVSHQEYKKRVIQMGENPKNVFCIGSLGVQNIVNTKILKKKQLEKKININLAGNILMVSYHPETILQNSTTSQFKELLQAIKYFKNIKFIFTSPNADPGNNKIITMIKKFVKKNANAFYIPSFGQSLFFSCINYSDGMIGNSSSGIIEVPAFRKGTINIGKRQGGRIKSTSIIDTSCARKKIILSIKKLYSKKFQKKLKTINNPFYKKNTTKTIVSVVKKKLTREINVNKKFFDLNFRINK